jgi:hypothetical protein
MTVYATGNHNLHSKVTGYTYRDLIQDLGWTKETILSVCPSILCELFPNRRSPECCYPSCETCWLTRLGVETFQTLENYNNWLLAYGGSDNGEGRKAPSRPEAL